MPFLESCEGIVFIAPMGAHNTIEVQTWQAVMQWDLQTDDENTIVAVRFGIPSNDAEYSQGHLTPLEFKRDLRRNLSLTVV